MRRGLYPCFTDHVSEMQSCWETEGLGREHTGRCSRQTDRFVQGFGERMWLWGSSKLSGLMGKTHMGKMRKQEEKKTRDRRPEPDREGRQLLWQTLRSPHSEQR